MIKKITDCETAAACCCVVKLLTTRVQIAFGSYVETHYHSLLALYVSVCTAVVSLRCCTRYAVAQQHTATQQQQQQKQHSN